MKWRCLAQFEVRGCETRRSKVVFLSVCAAAAQALRAISCDQCMFVERRCIWCARRSLVDLPRARAGNSLDAEAEPTNRRRNAAF